MEAVNNVLRSNLYLLVFVYRFSWWFPTFSHKKHYYHCCCCYFFVTLQAFRNNLYFFFGETMISIWISLLYLGIWWWTIQLVIYSTDGVHVTELHIPHFFEIVIWYSAIYNLCDWVQKTPENRTLWDCQIVRSVVNEKFVNRLHSIQELIFAVAFALMEFEICMDDEADAYFRLSSILIHQIGKSSNGKSNKHQLFM